MDESAGRKGLAIKVATSDMDKPVGPAGEGPLKNAVLIAGPTASGKSGLAMRLARERGGVIVNADSMQVYAVMRVLTARPGEEDCAAVEHRLYGHVHPSQAYSTGRWLADVAALIADGAVSAARPAVFVGGTGLYFRALTDGLSPIPEVDDAIRRGWREALARDGAAALHRLLATRDAHTAATLRASDGQRIVRALEVLDSTGRPLSHWQSMPGRPVIDTATATLLVIEPDRRALADRIDRRFDAMMAAGAVDEARAMAALALDPEAPAMKAIGVRELLAAERGAISPAEAVDRAKAATRQYAKRQSTWFRNQLDDAWRRLPSDRAG